jgi:hypothetical protein
MTEDQANAEFADILFGNEENAEWADVAAADAPQPEPKVLKESGVSYAGDVVLKTGAVESRYAFTWKGQILFYIHVELGVTVPAPSGLHYTGQAISWHPIVVKSVDGMKSISTNGAAVMAAHEGETAHVDGLTVQAYVLPRVMDYMVKLYVA